MGFLSIPPGVVSASDGFYVFDDTISSDTENYDLYDKLVDDGWDETFPVRARVTIENGVVVGSASTGTPAFNISFLPAGSNVDIFLFGGIQGRGGKGGDTHCNGDDVNDLSADDGEDGGDSLVVRTPTRMFGGSDIEGPGGGAIWGTGGGGGGATMHIRDEAGALVCEADASSAGGGGAGFPGGAGGVSTTSNIPSGWADECHRSGFAGEPNLGGCPGTRGVDNNDCSDSTGVFCTASDGDLDCEATAVGGIGAFPDQTFSEPFADWNGDPLVSAKAVGSNGALGLAIDGYSNLSFPDGEGSFDIWGTTIN